MIPADMRAFIRTAMMIPMLVALLAGNAGAAGFVEGVEDLPLMDGLESEPGSAVVFDKPGGRIIETFAVGKVAKADAVAFYEATLPQLGWARARKKAKPPALAFEREGETLRLEFKETGGALRVRFAIAPD
jgi:hypothetical protein